MHAAATTKSVRASVWFLLTGYTLVGMNARGLLAIVTMGYPRTFENDDFQQCSISGLGGYCASEELRSGLKFWHLISSCEEAHPGREPSYHISANRKHPRRLTTPDPHVAAHPVTNTAHTRNVPHDRQTHTHTHTHTRTRAFAYSPPRHLSSPLSLLVRKRDDAAEPARKGSFRCSCRSCDAVGGVEILSW